MKFETKRPRLHFVGVEITYSIPVTNRSFEEVIIATSLPRNRPYNHISRDEETRKRKA